MPASSSIMLTSGIISRRIHDLATYIQLRITIQLKDQISYATNRVPTDPTSESEAKPSNSSGLAKRSWVWDLPICMVRYNGSSGWGSDRLQDPGN